MSAAAGSIQELTTAQKAVAHGHEQSGRTVPEVRKALPASGQPTQIGARSDEFVPLWGEPPAASSRAASTGVDVGRDFDRESGARRRAPGYQQHRHMGERRIVAISSRRRTPKMLPIPDLTLADDEAGQVKEAPTDHLRSTSSCATSFDPLAVQTTSILRPYHHNDGRAHYA